MSNNDHKIDSMRCLFRYTLLYVYCVLLLLVSNDALHKLESYSYTDVIVWD
jgi:hypothetical protein